MALPPKCAFLKKPLETLLLSQTKRSLFIESALKCPVMSELLTKSKENGLKKGEGKCPFSSNSVLETLTNTVNKAIRTAASNIADATSCDVFDENIRDHNVKNVNINIDATENFAKPVIQCMEEKDHVKEKVSISRFPYDSYFNKMIQKKKDDHSYRVFRKVNRNASRFPKAEDFTFSEEAKEITVWCSNDYLGMSRHKSVVQAAKNIINQNGVGAGGTRNISGTSSYHGKLEELLAKWHHKEAGLLFTSCYIANDTTLFTLGQKLPGCVIYSDEGNHASMIHGIRTSGAKKFIFRHNDPEHLEELLKKSDPDVPKIVAFETVHSMSGTITPLETLCDVAHKYGALTFVDEVHAVGLYGHRGAGIGERDGVLDKMDIISGTLGKAIGCIGGYIVGNAALIDTIRSYGSGFIFTTALPPDKVFAAIKSLEILSDEEGQNLRQRHQANVRKLRTKLVQHGFPVENAPSHIVPVLAGDPDKCLKVSHYLQQWHGIYIQSINYPTVPRGQEKLRIAPTPFHTDAMMDDLINSLDEAWIAAGLDYLRPVCEVGCNCQNICDQQIALRT